MTEAKKKTVKPAGKSAPPKGTDEKSVKEAAPTKKKAKAVGSSEVSSAAPTSKPKKDILREPAVEKAKTKKKVSPHLPPAPPSAKANESLKLPPLPGGPVADVRSSRPADPAIKTVPVIGEEASVGLKKTGVKGDPSSAVPRTTSKPTHPAAENPVGPTVSAPSPAKASLPPTVSPTPPARPAEPALVLPKPTVPVRAPAPAVPTPPVAPRPKVVISESITVKELSDKMGVKIPDLLKKLLGMGVIANLNQRLDTDTATLAADAFNFDVDVKSLLTDEAIVPADDPNTLQPRPPVVTVMGHVDHGKTSLLDAIRSARVAEKEAGGITQHIGAYQVRTDRGVVTFLDTPGHEAFTAMRSRGAQATDIVVLVVAADDGVMPQTVEALDHAKAAGVPIVVAINKCDLPTANPQRIKQELAGLGLQAEDWGGKTVMVEVSARKKTNIDTLLEMILLEAELLELKANPHRPAQGIVVEAKLDPRRGPVATVLIQKGTLRVGDSFLCGVNAGKIRALIDDRGDRVKDAGPAFPVEILGLSGTPMAGDTLVVLASDREAREIAERRQVIADAEARRAKHHLSLEEFHKAAESGKVKSLPIVLKADVQGSLEAVKESLVRLGNAEIAVRVIHAGVGGINNSDVVLAAASDAIVLGFNVRPDPSSESMAQREGIEIKTYRIIYDMVNEVKAALEGLLEPEEKEVTQGWAEVRKVFMAPKVGAVAGCMVTDGKVSRTARVRLIRNGAIVHEGGLGSLKRFKDDVKEVERGFECGLSLGNYKDVRVGDRLEFYLIEKVARKLA
ncbi:MAG: translation initiation factor IF-2 [Elusimicrobia bacterium]|nr:translation initiation factor IF-2 [Elusimicrobiota bacterium]